MLELDSAIQSLVHLRTCLNSVDKARGMTSTALLKLLPTEPTSEPLRKISPTPLSSSIVDSLPSNPLFTHAPEYESQEEYLNHHGCSGSTDPLAPERAMLSTKQWEMETSM